MVEYLKHSGIWLGLIINPWHWHFLVDFSEDLGYNFSVTLGFIWIRIVINDKNY